MTRKGAPAGMIGLLVALSLGCVCADVENLAFDATISASGRHSEGYHPRFVTDGMIPRRGSRSDVRKAWCLPQVKSKDAWISFAWKEPVEIASIVYWGRTAWMDTENFSACRVYIDGAEDPAASAALQQGAQAQVIKLDRKHAASELRLVFPGNFGGANPGASEIGIFPGIPSDKELSNLSRKPVRISAEMRKRLGRGEFGFTSMLAVQRQPVNSTHVYTYHQEGLQPGGGLWVVDFGGGEVGMRKILDSPEGEILDAGLHYDGRTVLFSWKRTMSDFFQLYTIGIDGSGLKQVTDHESNNFNASFLPDGGIVFLSDRKPAFAYCWRTTTPILWRSNGDGSGAMRISSNYLNDFTPSVLEDGRVIYSRWEYVDRPAIPIQSLWTINPDGTMLAGLFGNRSLSPGTFMDAREIPGSGGRILCVLTAHGGPCRGAIGIVDPAVGGNAQEAITNLTPEIDIGKVDAGNGDRVRGPYLNPYPIDGNHYLVSMEGTVQLRDYRGDLCQPLIGPGSDGGFYNPRPIRPRKREKIVASGTEPKPGAGDAGWATIMMQDVYHGLGDAVERGAIKELAVVQEIEKPVGVNPSLRAFGFQFPVVSCGATYAPKKIWGYAKVEQDGSANFRVPAEKPIYFLPLDGKGMAVQRMRTFTHLMPGEVQSCVGCHADRNYAMVRTTHEGANRPVAMLRETQDLEEPEWGVHGFSYPHIVQPILDKHCVECHGPEDPAADLELSADKTDFFNVSYENLCRKGTSVERDWMSGGVGGEYKYSKYTSWISTHNGQEENILEIAPGRWGAKASLLAEIVASGHPDEDGKGRVSLSDSEARRIYAWLDLNCPYYGTSDSNYMDLRGCRRQLPEDFGGMMKSIGSRRCASCHEGAGKDGEWVLGLENSSYVRIDNPQRNNFLLAPLAKSAGGSEKCGEAVFKDVNDADYRAIMAAFGKLREKLDDLPRFDMLKLEEQKPGGQEARCRTGG